MCINQMEKVVLQFIVKKFNELKEEEELIDFASEQNGYGTEAYPKEQKLRRVSVRNLYQEYPKYSLVQKLVDFSQLAVNFIFQHPSNQWINTKIYLLVQNGFEFSLIDEHALYYAINTNIDSPFNEPKIAFALKINDIYVDFDFFLPLPELKGIGEEVYSNIFNFQTSRDVGNERKEESIENYEANVLLTITRWATSNGLNFLNKTKHLRRKGVPLRDINIKLEMSSHVITKQE